MPIISIIVPVYNTAAYLHRCFDSILAQSFQDFELIIVDDGSTDQSGTICDSYAEMDPRIIVIHTENQGVSAARNRALLIASGEYLAFCDSDDSWSCDWLQTLYAKVIASGADSVVASYTQLSASGERVREHRHSFSGVMDFDNPSTRMEYLCNYILLARVGWEIWTRLFRRSVVAEHNIRFCENCGNFAEDLGFILAFTSFSNREESIDYCGYNHFDRESSMMHLSQSVVKLNQMNEVSRYFLPFFSEAFRETTFRSSFSIVHFGIMFEQLKKLYSTKRLMDLDSEMARIENLDWCINWFRKIPRSYRLLRRYLGVRKAKQVLLLSHYCVHRNYKRFAIESSLAYRFWIPKQA